MFRLLIATFFCVGLTACANEENQTSINPTTLTNNEVKPNLQDPYTLIAMETCDCMQPMIEKVTEAETLSQTHNSSSQKLLNSLQEIDDIRPQIVECNQIVKNRYDKILGKNPNAQLLLEALKHHCPDTYAVLSKGISMKN